MKHDTRVRKCSAFGTILLGLVGCTTYELNDRQLAYNDALQDAQNRQVLLNVVRASYALPLFFTATGQITSTGTFDGTTLAATIPFGAAAKPSYSLTPI